MEYYSEVLPLIIKADQIIKNLFFSVTPLYKKDFPEGQDVTIPLFTTLHTFSESILVLLQNCALFEADILLRCVMEGTVKYCFLMIGTSEERKEKYKEYKTILNDFGVAVYPREGHNLAEIKQDLLNEDPAYKIRLLDAPLVTVSSTEIREALSNGEDISHLLM